MTPWEKWCFLLKNLPCLILTTKSDEHNTLKNPLKDFMVNNSTAVTWLRTELAWLKCMHLYHVSIQRLDQSIPFTLWGNHTWLAFYCMPNLHRSGMQQVFAMPFSSYFPRGFVLVLPLLTYCARLFRVSSWLVWLLLLYCICASLRRLADCTVRFWASYRTKDTFIIIPGFDPGFKDTLLIVLRLQVCWIQRINMCVCVWL